MKTRIKICLAASGGGHVRQLLDLAPAWAEYDHFFISEDSALSRSIAKDHRTYFVSHVALGQAKLGSPAKMLLAGIRNFFQSASIILRERPDVLISTGAGAVYFPLIWGRLLGAKIVAVESFARFDRPSAFAKFAFPLAHRQVVQSGALASYWPSASVFDPLQIIGTTQTAKRPLVFATVGATLPFPRLVEIVAEGKRRGDISEHVLLQVGIGGERPPGLDTVETLSFEEVQSTLETASIVICHGGTGSLITALRAGCHVIAVPRRFELGEHYDNHQSEITEAFKDRGLITVVNSADELAEVLPKLRDRSAIAATSNPEALNQYLRDTLAQWDQDGGRRSSRT